MKHERMQGEFWRITNEVQRANCVRALMAMDMPLRVQMRQDRSLDQNSLSHVWYAAIAKQGREYSVAEARRYCKLHIGVPIMRAADEGFRDGWDTTVKQLPYETKLKIMDWWPVTSLMGKDEMREYLTAMQVEFAGRGILLEGLPPTGTEQYPEAQRGAA